MICPHCQKPIKYEIDQKTVKRARELVKQGFSMRETEKILYKEGMSMSFSTISRMFRTDKDAGK